MGFPRGTARGRAGYTLVELMVVVTIIGISVTAFAPGFSRAMNDRRVSTASRELIRIGRRARSDTFGYLRAHLLWFTPASGRVQLLRSPTNSCTLTVWKPVLADCSASPVGARCLEDLSLTRWAVGGRAIGMREETLTGTSVSYATTPRALCFAPSGVTSYGAGTDIENATVNNLRDTIDTTVPGGFVYALYAGTGEPIATSRMHRVLFPLGASPRALR